MFFCRSNFQHSKKYLQISFKLNLQVFKLRKNTIFNKYSVLSLKKLALLHQTLLKIKNYINYFSEI